MEKNFTPKSRGRKLFFLSLFCLDQNILLQILLEGHQMGPQIWLAHQFGLSRSTWEPERMESLRSSWDHWRAERSHGLCQRTTFPGLYSHHCRVYLSAPVPRRCDNIWNYE